MGLGDFPGVLILLLLESAKITGGATTKPTISPPATSTLHHFASVADATSGMETPAAETSMYLPSSVVLLSETTSPWSTVGETSRPGGATTLPTSSSPEASTPVGTSHVSPSSSSLETTSVSSTGFGRPSEEGNTHPVESTMLPISSTTEEMSSSPPTPQDKRTSEGPLTTISITSQEESTSENHPTSPSFTETMKRSPLSVPHPTPTVATSTLLSASSVIENTTREATTSSEAEITSWRPGNSLPSISSSVTQDRSTLKVTSVGLLSSHSGRTSLGLPAPPSTNPTSENSTTTLQPTPQDMRTSEVFSTTVSTTSPVETTSEKHPSSPPIATQMMKSSPSSVPLLISTLGTSPLPRATSEDPTASPEVTTGSEVTSWRPGNSFSSTSSSVTQDRSTSKVTSVDLLSSNPGRTSLGLPAPASTNPTSEYPSTPSKLPFSTTSPSASTALPETPARSLFILSVRLSTSLNIMDPSVSHAVRKWLNQELQAKFPASSFNLTWIG